MPKGQLVVSWVVELGTYLSVRGNPPTSGGGGCQSNGRTIQQQLNATFNPAATYSLSVDVGHRLDVPFPSTGAYIQLLAGTQVIASVATPVPSSGGFLTVTATYNPRRDNRNHQYDQYVGQPLTIRLGSNDGNTFTGQVNWDNVKLRKQ